MNEKEKSIVKSCLSLVPYIGGVINEVISYYDSKYLEMRLQKLENSIYTLGCSVEKFEEKINGLDEHQYYCTRNNIRHLLTVALPETTDLLCHEIVKYVIGTTYDVEEVLCETIQELNAKDIDFLKHINWFKRKYADRLSAQYHSSKNPNINAFGLKERNQCYEGSTITWEDFCQLGYRSGKDIKAVPFEALMIIDFEHEELLGKPVDATKYPFFASSLLKMQRLGIIMTEFKTTLGTTNPSNIDRLHITAFGHKLLQSIAEVDAQKPPQD